MAYSLFLSALLLSGSVSIAHAGVPVDPLCEMKKSQDAQLRALVDQLKARAKGLTVHPDQPRMKEIVQHQLECLANFTQGPEKYCKTIRENEGHGPPLIDEQKVSDKITEDPLCGPLAATLPMENKAWHKYNDEILVLEKMKPDFKTCSARVGPWLVDELEEIKNPAHMDPYIESMGKVTDFPDSVDYSAEVKNEIARLKRLRDEVGVSYQVKRKRWKDCNLRAPSLGKEI